MNIQLCMAILGILWFGAMFSSIVLVIIGFVILPKLVLLISAVVFLVYLYITLIF